MKSTPLKAGLEEREKRKLERQSKKKLDDKGKKRKITGRQTNQPRTKRTKNSYRRNLTFESSPEEGNSDEDEEGVICDDDSLDDFDPREISQSGY